MRAIVQRWGSVGGLGQCHGALQASFGPSTKPRFKPHEEQVDRLTNLIAIFENPALDFTKNRADGDDLLGDAYEYLMRLSTGPRPIFSRDDFAQIAAVMSALASASTPLNAAAIAATFKQGRKVAPKVSAVLAALARTGFLANADGGATFSLRRVA